MASTKTESKGPGRSAIPLAKRIAELEQDKCVDVSKITENGSGATTVKTPSSSSTKVMGATLPMISNNLETYEIALNLLNLSDEEYETELEAFKANLAATEGKPRRGRKPAGTPPTPVVQSADTKESKTKDGKTKADKPAVTIPKKEKEVKKDDNDKDENKEVKPKAAKPAKTPEEILAICERLRAAVVVQPPSK